jgi:hypothetical protein
MSFDLQICSVHPASALEDLPTPTAWKANDQSWMHERSDWQVVSGRYVKVLPEDVPETVAQTLPGITYLMELNLSPIDAPETNRKFLSRSAAAIAKAIHGVVFDPQADYVTLPSGIKRFAGPATSARELVNPNGSKLCSTALDSGRTPTTDPRRLLVGL